MQKMFLIIVLQIAEVNMGSYLTGIEIAGWRRGKKYPETLFDSIAGETTVIIMNLVNRE